MISTRGLTAGSFVALLLVLSSSFAHAMPMTFVGDLSGANEVPPVASTGTGLATIVLDPTAQTIQISVTFSGLTSNDTAAHIHCCAPLGINVGVATMLPTFTGFPLGVTSGTYSMIFDLAQPTFYNPSFVTLEGGLFSAEAALIAGIEGGQTYFNIHTATNPGGEIRGQLLPAPEPSSLLLLASALIGLGMMRWRKLAARF